MNAASTVEKPSPTAARPAIISRLLSFPAMLAFMLCVLGVLTVRNRFDDPDAWWHLRTGQVILQTHSIPHTDLFSSTAYGKKWIPHEWLAEISIAAAYNAGGYTGLMLWLAGFTCLLFILQYLLCWVYSKNAKVSLIGGMITWIFSTIGLAIRPQLLGYCLLSIELLVLLLGATRNRRWFLALPFIFAIWINVHGSFFFGLLAAGAVFCCSFLHFEAGPIVAHRWSSSTRWWLAGAIAASAVALFLNPTGFEQIWYPIDTLFNQPKNLQYVDEWQPMAFNDARTWLAVGLLAAIAVIAMYRRGVIRIEEIVLLGASFYMSGSHMRMIFVFGIIAAPVISRLLAPFWDNWEPDKDPLLANTVMIAGALTVIWFGFPDRALLEEQIREHNPVKAIAYVRSAGLKGPMLNDYTMGGYLIWALPEHKVFMDGRADLHEWAGTLAKYAAFIKLQEDPAKLLSNYRIGFCLLRKDAPIGNVLPHLGWKQVYKDDLAQVLVNSH